MNYIALAMHAFVQISKYGENRVSRRIIRTGQYGVFRDLWILVKSSKVSVSGLYLAYFVHQKLLSEQTGIGITALMDLKLGLCEYFL